MQFFIKQKNKPLGPFSIEELKQQPINRNSLIWFQGQQAWEKLEDIPELTEVYNSLPPEKSNRKVLWIVLSTLFFSVIGGGGYWYLFEYKKQAPLTTEELYNKYSKSVALIKHSYLYKIRIADKDYYFKSYDHSTGELSELLSLDEAKKDPNVVWGTGFFIDDKGKMLTCRHVVDVMPSKDDEKAILDWFRVKAQTNLSDLNTYRSEIENSYLKVSNLLYLYGASMSSFNYFQFTEKKNELKEKYDDISSKIKFWEYFSTIATNPNNFVSKTSLQFGIFLNDTTTTTMDDYIKCKSVKISSDENVDLAIIQTTDKKLPDDKIVPLNFHRITDIDKTPVKLTEKVRMIGFNYGIQMANTSKGIKSQITEGTISQNSDEFKMLYTIPALQGSSGSPIFDEYGQLISVNYAGVTNSQSFNFGIQAKKIKAFLDK